MRVKTKITPLLLFTLLLATGLAACNSSSSNTVAAVNPTITGAAIDGYVRDAALTVYSDLAMTTAIGSGTTNAGGQFTIELLVATVPDPMYIRSVGGMDIDTGFTAPTMTFVTSGSPTTGINITPLTSVVYERVLSGSPLSTALVDSPEPGLSWSVVWQPCCDRVFAGCNVHGLNIRYDGGHHSCG